jgi:hypothetical protein
MEGPAGEGRRAAPLASAPTDGEDVITATAAPTPRDVQTWLGAATGIGSLPGTDARAAASLAVGSCPDLPTLPELPARSGHDTMIGLVTSHVRGVRVFPDGDLVVDSATLEAPAVTPGVDAALAAFAAAIEGRTAPVKWQRCGPVTLAIALVAGGADVDGALDLAVRAVRPHLHLVHDTLGRSAPGAVQLAVLDEPGLAAAGHPSFPWSPDDVIDAISTCLADLEAHGCTTGVHCCAPVDWSLVIDAGAQVLFAPVGGTLGQSPATVARHLERGGAIAWGAVPTVGPIGTSPDRLWHALAEEWCRLVNAGCDPVVLRRQALVTPECGLAFHDPAQAERLLAFCRTIGDRVRSQAVAARFTLGA